MMDTSGFDTVRFFDRNPPERLRVLKKRYDPNNVFAGAYPPVV